MPAPLQRIGSLYADIIKRARACQAKVSPTDEWPVAEVIVYKTAMKIATDASVEEMLGGLDRCTQN